jgi:predicted transcriptional regulator
MRGAFVFLAHGCEAKLASPATGALHRPESIRALGGLVDRDVKNVAGDLALLASLGLVEMEVKDRSARRKAPRVDYETLTLEVHL